MVEAPQEGETTIDIFQKRAIEFQKVNPQESRRLAGELLLWASSTNQKGSLGEILATQINHRVEIHCKSGIPTTTEKFVEMLFSPNPVGIINADLIMYRLQFD